MEEHRENSLDTLLIRTEDYLKTSFELFKLNTLKEILKVVSAVITRATVILFFFMFFLIASIAVAILIGDTLGELWYGFIIVAAFYGIIATIISLFLSNWFKNVVSNFIIKQIQK
ncbi:MAG: phage holin family protein [Bacteroidales bacterium]|nr:phage holin family protein [Bacteroidales bacterium]